MLVRAGADNKEPEGGTGTIKSKPTKFSIAKATTDPIASVAPA